MYGPILWGTNRNATFPRYERSRVFAKPKFASLVVQGSLSRTTIMSSVFKDLSASISMPSATSLVQFSKVQLPNILSSASEVATWTNTTLAILFTLLILEQSVYRYKKKHLPGDSWTIPIIGKFADSMKPTMEGYMKQWNAGALSALSVFNMSACFIFVLVGTLTFNRYSLDLLSWRLARSTREKFSTRLRTQNRA